MVAHEVDDEVVGSGDDNDGGESTSEVVRVVGNGLILDLLVVLAELVTIQCVRKEKHYVGVCKNLQSVTVFLATNSVDTLELGDVEGVSITVVEVSIVTADRAITLVVVVRVR